MCVPLQTEIKLKTDNMISVIVNLHNNESSIISALQSIVAQTAQKWEAVVIDNASSDGSEHQVRSYLIDRRMRYVRLEEEVSLQEARRKGLELTTGEWVMYLDGTDYLEPNALESLYLTAKKYGTLIAAGNFFTENGEKHQDNFLEDGKYKGKDATEGKFGVVTGSAIFARQVAHLPESWRDLDYGFTHRPVVIHKIGTQPLVPVVKRKPFWRRFFR